MNRDLSKLLNKGSSGQRRLARALARGRAHSLGLAELTKDFGGAGAPMTGGMVSTPVAGSGIRRKRRNR